jgi:hypothetical protein
VPIDAAQKPGCFTKLPEIDQQSVKWFPIFVKKIRDGKMLYYCGWRKWVANGERTSETVSSGHGDTCFDPYHSEFLQF